MKKQQHCNEVVGMVSETLSLVSESERILLLNAGLLESIGELCKTVCNWVQYAVALHSSQWAEYFRLQWDNKWLFVCVLMLGIVYWALFLEACLINQNKLVVCWSLLVSSIFDCGTLFLLYMVADAQVLLFVLYKQIVDSCIGNIDAWNRYQWHNWRFVICVENARSAGVYVRPEVFEMWCGSMSASSASVYRQQWWQWFQITRISKWYRPWYGRPFEIVGIGAGGAVGKLKSWIISHTVHSQLCCMLVIMM